MALVSPCLPCGMIAEKTITKTITKTVNAPAVRLIATGALVNVALPRLKVNDNDNDNEDDNEDENLNELSLTPHQAKPINLPPRDN